MSSIRAAVPLAAILLLSACVTDDQQATRAQGAGAGAALGAGIGALAGGDTEDVLIGAAVGGLAGLAIGDTVARKKADYASAEDMVVQERQIVANRNDQLRTYNAGLARELDQLNREIVVLEARAERQADAYAERLALRKRAEANLHNARKRLVEVNHEIDISRNIHQEAVSGSEAIALADWDLRIGELERRRDALITLIIDFENSVQRIV